VRVDSDVDGSVVRRPSACGCRSRVSNVTQERVSLRVALDYDLPDATDLERVVDLMTHAFAVTPVSERRWLDAIGREHLRILRGADGLQSVLGLLPMGQFFGGQTVSIAGVAGVAVRADRLRRGVATEMMSRTLAELHAHGVGLATLYASTWSLYRRVGFEVAGTRSLARFPPTLVRGWDHDLSVRIATIEDRPAVAELYRTIAREHDGHLDRCAYIWRRIDDERLDVPAHGLLVDDDEGLAGYVYYRKHMVPGRGPHRIEIADICARSRMTWQRLWTALADLGAMVESIDLPTAPQDPAFVIHEDPRFRMELLENWMVRVTHVQAALSQRGYPMGVRARVDFDLVDDVIPQQSGRWRLKVADGVGQIERGGEGTIRVEPRGLAALITGFLSGPTLARLGRIQSGSAALAATQAVFAGTSPWMREMF